MHITISTRDELFIIPSDDVLFFKAEGHYSCAYFASGAKTLLPIGLSSLWDTIALQPALAPLFIRTGRSHIVGRTHLCHISKTKETCTFSAEAGQRVTIHLAKASLRELVEFVGKG